MPSGEEERHAELLRLLDRATPPLDVEEVIARARIRMARRRRVARRAAGVMLLFAAGAAAAMPGSPVRHYLDAVREPRRTHRAGATPAGAPERHDAPQDQAGVAFEPSANVRVVFRDTQSVGAVRVVIGSALSVRLTHRAGTAAYAMTPDGIEIDNAGSSASFELVLPASLADATIRVGPRTVLHKRGANVRADVQRDSSGAYVIPLASSPAEHRRSP